MPSREPLSPAEAWESMLAGNARFVSGTQEHPGQDEERRKELSEAQAPFAVLFGCSDSRIAAELIFDVGLGDLFVVRTAGQVLDATVIASIEYAVATLGTSLVVVLAHDHCGAVQAAFEAGAGGNLPSSFFVRDLVARIQPAVVESQRAGIGTVDDVAGRHLIHTCRELITNSSVISAAIDEGHLAVVGANYELTEGKIHEIAAFGRPTLEAK